MKATWNDTVLAEAPKEDLIKIEGNWYFPPDSLQKQALQPSDKHTTCFWKGEANYYNVVAKDQTNPDAAWFYPEPKDGSVERVGKDYKDYVAFWGGVEVTE